jgi:3-hydroxybutyryl-CoA dehydrogenase
MSTPDGYQRPAIAGSGTIACGLAACASTVSEVRMLARSDASAWRAEEQSQKLASKLEGAIGSRIKVTTDPADLADSDIVVEAIVEELEPKAKLLSQLGGICPDADLASTTSSLSITQLGEACGHPDRFFGLHVFNPVTRMELVELCVPDGVREGVLERARAWCAALNKTAVEVPDKAGFVVNRLLFPYLFDAVRYMEETGLTPAAIDDCMRLGAGHPMGPLKLIDLVGVDVSVAIGDSLHAASGDPAHEPPETLRRMAREGKLGRKTGEGFYTY